MPKRKILLLLITLTFGTASAWAHQYQKKIAFTFDDLPCLESYSSLERVIQINQRIIDALRKNDIQSVVFVNECKIHYRNETGERIKILEKWLNNGHEIGNHTANHQNAMEISFEEFRADVIGGEKTIGQLMAARGQRLRFFRYPYLERGKNPLKTKKFLEKRGYTIVEISLDPKDWKFNARYKTITEKYEPDSKEVKALKEEFLRNLKGEIEAVLNRPNPEILLLHACTLTSLLIDDIIETIRQCGYTFCTLEEALEQWQA